jgi:hypothetical protein
VIRDAVTYILDRPKQPWLVVGKGPSFDRWAELAKHLPDEYGVITLGSACLTAAAIDLALFMDLESCLKCWQKRPPLPYCLPWHPHVGYKPAEATLPYYVKEGLVPHDVLSFNSSTAGKLKRHPTLSHVRVRGFSSVAAFNLLGKAGIDTVYAIGVDGGTEYAAPFDTADCLANGQPSFDGQFKEIGLACQTYGMDYYNLGRNRDKYDSPVYRG